MTGHNNKNSIQKDIDYILRYAINHNDIAGYNPCAYHLGFDDSNIPSNDFNNELRKYGDLKSNTYNDDFEGYNYNNGWNSFIINDKGKQYIKEKNEFKGIKIILSLLLNIIQVPFIIEGWISCFLLLIIKLLSRVLFIISLISFVWWPIDMLSLLGWMFCDYLKFKIWGKFFLFEASRERYLNHFPDFFSKYL